METVFTKEEISEICARYGIQVQTIGEEIDSSHGESDRRLAYQINDSYMLKAANASAMNEDAIQLMADLVERYRSIGVYCPAPVRDLRGAYANQVFHDGGQFTAYIEEFAKLAFADSVTGTSADGDWVREIEWKKEMMAFTGKLAARYVNVGLTKRKSMWSIIDLGPWDVEVDEKQENMDLLTQCLCDHGRNELADKLACANEEARNRIQEWFQELPRCVFQGDLNLSNLLIDENGHAAGLIDFNMAGTEVTINCLLNEAMVLLKESDYETDSPQELLERICAFQEELMECARKYYSLNEVELRCYDAYRKVILMSMYPNVMCWKHMLDEGRQTEKVVELLNLIAEMEIGK